MNRNRILYAFLIVFVVLVGLASRFWITDLPAILNVFLGDALWAVMIFLFTGMLFKHEPVWKVAVISLLFCYLIEISQLYQASWILELRSTVIGALILGHGFLWSDIIAYSAGIGVAATIEFVVNRMCDRK